MFIIFVPPFLPRTNAWQPLLKRKKSPYNQIQCQRMSNRRTNQTYIKKRKRSKNIFSTHFFFVGRCKKKINQGTGEKKAPLRLEVTFRQHAENSARKAEDRSGEKLDYRETLARLCHNAMATHTHTSRAFLSQQTPCQTWACPHSIVSPVGRCELFAVCSPVKHHYAVRLWIGWWVRKTGATTADPDIIRHSQQGIRRDSHVCSVHFPLLSFVSFF